jgi:hypothetical protein
MQLQPLRPRQGADRRNFLRLIDAASFGGLRDRDGMRPRLMHIAADRTGDGADAVRRQLGVLAIGQQQLGTMGEKARRAALVILDMSVAVADHSAIRLHHRRQSKAVGRRTAGHPDRADRATEQRRKGFVQRLGQAVIVIGWLRASASFIASQTAG